MATYPFDKQTTGCNSPHDWLVSLAMDLTACFVLYVEVKMARSAPMDAIWLVLVKTEPLPATSCLPAHPPTL